MPLTFNYIWQGADDILLFKWLYNSDRIHNSLVHVYSMFRRRPVHPHFWHSGKKVFYSGEAIMDETHANVVVRFLSATDNTSPRQIINMTYSHRQLLTNKNRPGVRYIQLRLQELDSIEWKIKGLISAGILAQESFSEIREYLLCSGNITPYADMMLSWQRNRPVVANDGFSTVSTGLLAQPDTQSFSLNSHLPLVGLELSGNNMDSRRKFCLFMVSNPLCKLRNDTFMLLSRIGNVVSAGGYMNNLADGDTRPPDRLNHDEYINYLRQFRFMITFENQSLPGYHTEKITNAFEAGVIPIYWGDPMITDIYDVRSFIHIPTLDNPNQQWDAIKQAVARVQEAECDPQVYGSYFQYQPMRPEVCQREDARVAASIQAISNELS